MCDFDEVDIFCPDGFVCEGECCVPECEDEGGEEG
jgi:hypothetical protein